MVKVLFAGDVGGKVEQLFKRVSTVNASNGPFDLLLCTGGFFAGSGPDDDDYTGELLPYITGDKKAPVPTYFIGGWGHGSKQALEALAASDSNVKYLGRSGVATVGGLIVAFLDGQYNAAAYREGGQRSAGCRYYVENDMDRLKLALAKAEGDVDVLLTNEWAQGVCDGLPDAAKPQGIKLDGAAMCAEVALACRPRYHIAAGKKAFFARAPYLNADLGAGGIVTRFIALADVGNAAKQKWLHALGLMPATEMTPEQLTAVPEGTTKCPYEVTSRKRAAEEMEREDARLGEQDWRWQQRGNKRQQRDVRPIAAPSLGRKDIVKDKRKTAFVSNVPFRATEDDIVDFFSQCGQVVDVVRRTNDKGRLNAFCHIQFDSVEAMERACQLTGSQLMGRTLLIDAAISGKAAAAQQQQAGKAVEGCWFCLSNPNADVELVASVGEECYVALDKGAINDYHVLVMPVEHFPSSLSAPSSATEEMQRYLSALRSCFAASGKELVGFERYMALRKSGGNHCHFNAIAVPAAAAQRAKEAFEAGAARQGFSFKHLPKATGDAAARAQLRAEVGEGEYFIALLPDGSRLVHPIKYGERFPLNYGREVLAELAGAPERADWKACALKKEEEEARCERFKEAFKAFDIMQ